MVLLPLRCPRERRGAAGVDFARFKEKNYDIISDYFNFKINLKLSSNICSFSKHEIIPIFHSPRSLLLVPSSTGAVDAESNGA